MEIPTDRKKIFLLATQSFPADNTSFALARKAGRRENGVCCLAPRPCPFPHNLSSRLDNNGHGYNPNQITHTYTLYNKYTHTLYNTHTRVTAIVIPQRNLLAKSLWTMRLNYYNPWQRRRPAESGDAPHGPANNNNNYYIFFFCIYNFFFLISAWVIF